MRNFFTKKVRRVKALNFGNKKYVKILSPSVSKAQLSKVVKQEFGYKSKK